MTILAGETAGKFQTHTDIAIGASTVPFGLTIADFNGDHVPDLAVADFASNTASILLGKGPGTFKSAVAYATGFGPVGLTAGDFNGDGLPDLALADAGSDLVSILLDKSDGTFQSASGVAMGPLSFGTASGDFNGDGKLDLVTANDNAFYLSVSLGDGKGGFSPHVDYMAGLFPDSVVAVDLNLDGKLDLVSANAGADTVSVLLGNGDGTFRPRLRMHCLKRTTRLSWWPETSIMTANRISPPFTYSNTVSILLGNGDGTLQTNVDYPAGNYPFGLVVDDFNGDGVLDLAVTNSNCAVPGIELPRHRVTSFRERRWPVPSARQLSSGAVPIVPCRSRPESRRRCRSGGSQRFLWTVSSCSIFRSSESFPTR